MSTFKVNVLQLTKEGLMDVYKNLKVHLAHLTVKQ